jgi:hypothetical protein
MVLMLGRMMTLIKREIKSVKAMEINPVEHLKLVNEHLTMPIDDIAIDDCERAREELW